MLHVFWHPPSVAVLYGSVKNILAYRSQSQPLSLSRSLLLWLLVSQSWLSVLQLRLLVLQLWLPVLQLRLLALLLLLSLRLILPVSFEQKPHVSVHLGRSTGWYMGLPQNVTNLAQSFTSSRQLQISHVRWHLLCTLLLYGCMNQSDACCWQSEALLALIALVHTVAAPLKNDCCLTTEKGLRDFVAVSKICSVAAK
ncbi:unnamed protein product [Toxocara canis]|uniref:Secreted protein n=1 Tax=Toxocara canis TaxID=6265 RepID=A0A183U551_TOXCA|nr:unnamed protein product [Toxocara canis]